MASLISRANGTPLETYSELLMRLDRMMADGQGDSEVADSLRDLLEITWYRMTQDELAVARQLSADLYTLHDDPLIEHPHDPRVYAPSLAADLNAARDRGDYLRALRLLQERPTEIFAEHAAMLRGICYEKLGLFDAALAFLDFAVSISKNPNSLNDYILISLHVHGRTDEAVRRVKSLLSEQQRPTIDLRVRAAGLLFDLSVKRQGSIAADAVKEAINLYDSVLNEIGTDIEGTHNREASIHCHTMLATCHFLLKEHDRALAEFNAALEVDPDNELALVLRGLLTCGTGFQAAKADFERAIQLGTKEFWPFYYLAFDALKSGDYDRCTELAESARRRVADRDLLARLYEWMAISLASRAHSIEQVPVDEVRRHFDLAISLSPANQVILANLRIFESALHEAQLKITWQFGLPVDPMTVTQQSLQSRATASSNGITLASVF